MKVLTDAGIIPGIKVDTGAKDMAGDPREKITEGLDGLRNRLAEYLYMGAQFAKRRALIAVDDGIPSRGYLEANAHALARYAGASGIDLPQASSGGRGCRRHGEVSLASRPRGRSGDLHSCRAADPIELASARFEYLECSVHAANGFRRWHLRLLAPAATGF